jgi:putative restriction endonuclease
LAVRDAAFSRVVRSAYDHRCAACGTRVIVWATGHSLVDAAHLVPRGEGSDDPRNGMALCKNHHWALDEYLIAPGPDRIWHVSPGLDERRGDERALIGLDGKVILLPREERFTPWRESLAWRVKHLLTV